MSYDNETIKALMKQHGCSRRMARRILRSGEPRNLEQRVADNETREGNTLGTSVSRLHASNGHRGPRKGPAKRPGGIGSDRWRAFMRGDNSSL